MRSISARSVTSTDRSALFVLPTVSGRSAAIDARLLAAAGLAKALNERLGGIEIVTPSGVTDPDQLVSGAVRPTTTRSPRRALLQRLPRSLHPAIGDIRLWQLNRRMEQRLRGLDLSRQGFIFQLHHRFQTAGLVAAHRAGVPFVLRLEALEVREETSWGTSRPGYGAIVERLGELAIIRAADLVVPVSADLDAVLEELGLPSDRRLVLPNGVDIARFSPGRADADLRRDHGMDGRFAVGWIGGFRPFHGLEVIPALARELKERVPNAVLCLVGTGPLRQRLIEETNGVDDVVRVVPPIPHEDVPRWIRSFDTCLLPGTSDVFHYSPMKLFEYLSCGRPVVAVGVGQVRQVITDGINGYLVEPGDIRSVVDRISRLAVDHSLRERMGNAARSGAEQSCSWGSRVDVLMEELRARYLVTSPANPLR